MGQRNTAPAAIPALPEDVEATLAIAMGIRPLPRQIVCGACGQTVTLRTPNPGFAEAAYGHANGQRCRGKPS